MADIIRKPVSWQRSLISAGGVMFFVHILGALLYAAAASPWLLSEILAGHELLTGAQFHLLCATISLPLALITIYFERRLDRLLGYLVIWVIFVIWIFAMIGVFLFIPEGKVVLAPTPSSSGESPLDMSKTGTGKTR